MSYPVPEVWKIFGNVVKEGGQPFTQGKIQAYDKYEGDEYYLGETGFTSDGHYEIIYSRYNFQRGDTTRTSPNLIVKILDYQNNVIWQSEVMTGVTHELLLNIDIENGVGNNNGETIPERWQVSGVITKSDSSLFDNGIVHLYDLFEGDQYILGTCAVKSSGTYYVQYNSSQFQHGTDKRQYPELIIKVFDKTGKLSGESALSYPPEVNQLFNYTLPVNTQLFAVSGNVKNSIGASVGNAKVELKYLILEDGKIQKKTLASTTTTSKGYYKLEYNPSSIPGISSLSELSILVEIVKELEGGENEVLARSSTTLNPGMHTEKELTVDLPSSSDISDYGETIDTLEENGFSEESLLDMAYSDEKIEFASSVTGKSQEEISAVCLSVAIHSKLVEALKDSPVTLDKVDQKVIYALVKSETVDNYNDVLKITPLRLNTVLISAIAQKVVPPESIEDVSVIVEEWQDVYHELLGVNPEETDGGLLINLAGIDDDDVIRRCYSKKAHDLSAFWEELEENDEVEEGTIDKLKFLFDLHEFADRFHPLIESMAAYAEDNGIIILEDFVKLSREDWDSITESIRDLEDDEKGRKTEWPEFVPGASDREKRKNYALILFRRIVSLFGMARFRYELETIEESELQWEEWDDVKEFLEIQSNSEFDFAEDINVNNIKDFVGDNEETVALFYVKMCKIQRIYRLTPRLRYIDALLKNKFESAVSIAHKNADDFIRDYSDCVGGVDEAHALHLAATHVASQTLFLMGTFNQQSDIQDESLPVVTERLTPVNGDTSRSVDQLRPMDGGATRSLSTMQSMESRKDSDTNIASNLRDRIRRILYRLPVSGVPDITTLFGNQNQCRCEDCQSVFSPSAYMVDLLEFVNDSVRNELFKRRPDLAHTDFSCRNTNGAVPIIDLVNEILENAVCSRVFYIIEKKAEENEDNGTGNQNGIFRSYINSNWEDGNVEVPEKVVEYFGSRGFAINKSFFLQAVKNKERVWNLVGDAWRYVIEDLDIEQDSEEEKKDLFKITPYPQTGKDAQLRRVKPEHEHWNAYEILKYPHYPAVLPFNLAFEEINELLKIRNSKRYKLLHLLQEETEHFEIKKPDQDIMKAFFETTDKQWEIINEKSDMPWSLWGLKKEGNSIIIPGTDETISGDWDKIISNAAVFLNRTGLSFDHFLDILSTCVVNYHGGIYLDWDEENREESYENADISKLWIKGYKSYTFEEIARFHRLCTHLEMDLFSVDRLLALHKNEGETVTRPISNIDKLYVYLRLAEEFSVDPLQAAVWIEGEIDNVNLGRGPLCQLEEVFISKIQCPERAGHWRTLVNDFERLEKKKFVTRGADGRYGADIFTLLSGMSITYSELSLIAYVEFRDGSGEEKQAADILEKEDLSIVSLGKMFRVVDFSKTLGVSVSDFYKLKNILVNRSTIKYFETEFIYSCQKILKISDTFSITLDEMDYLVSGERIWDITWLPEEKSELSEILKLHNDINVNMDVEAGDYFVEKKKIESRIIGEISALVGISDDIGDVLLRDVLKYQLYGGSAEPLIDKWVDVCEGGWVVDYKDEISDGNTIPGPVKVPNINIVSESEAEHEVLPEQTRFAQWTSNLVVHENGMYGINANLWAEHDDNEDDGYRDPGSIEIKVFELVYPPDDNGEEEDGNYEPEEIELDIEEMNLVRNKTYKIIVTWKAPTEEESDDSAKEIWEVVNIGCSIRKIDKPDSVFELLGTANTIPHTDVELIKIFNSAFLIKKLNITADQLSFLNAKRPVQGTINFNDLAGGYSNRIRFFINLFRTYLLSREMPFKRDDVDIFTMWKQVFRNPFNFDNYIDFISREVDWPLECIKDLVQSMGFSRWHLQRIDAWEYFNRCFKELRKIGITVSFASKLVSKADNTMEESKDFFNAVGSRYTISQWIEIAEPLRDSLRLRQRDALCAYLFTKRGSDSEEIGMEESPETIENILLHHKLGETGNDFEDKVKILQWLNEFDQTGIIDQKLWDVLDGRENYLNNAAIYGKYLIDIEMDSSVKTTRIVQANSSIQMFIQRAMLGFEHYVDINDKIKHQWAWMKNYRLWEANRKIFLYPENWLEPELRDNKTELFKEFEKELLQKEISDEAIEKVFQNYASGLSNIANLEIIGSYQDQSSEEVLYVVGRTYHAPHSHYFRKFYGELGGPGYWTSWEKVDLDINADVVIPVPFRNKVYLFWPVIELKEKTIEQEENESGSSDDEGRYKDSFKYYELKLAWSEYNDGKWSAKRISKEKLLHVTEHIDHEEINPSDLFHFKVEVRSNQIELFVFVFNKVIEEITVRTLVPKTKKIRKLFRRTRRKIYFEEIVEIFKEESESISKIARYSFGSDNSAKLEIIEVDPKVNSNNMMNSRFIPSGTMMRHNRAEAKLEHKASELGSLEYPKGNQLLKQVPDNYLCFPTNLSFFDTSEKPFFYQEREKSFCFTIPNEDLPKQYMLFTSKKKPPKSKWWKRGISSNVDRCVVINNFYHPLAESLVSRVNLSSIDSLFCRSVQGGSNDKYPLGYAMAGDEQARHEANLVFRYHYLPTGNILGDYPAPIIDFSLDSPYGVYNWEMFFHIPLFIATSLSNDHKYEEAMRWFHYIFNPGGDFTNWEKSQEWVSSLPPGARFWNFLPFFANKGVRDSIYKAVEKSQLDNQDTSLGSLIEEWKNDPFKPHLIARMRIAAYQKSVVMKYLDNLVSWADGLFRLDYMEAINEATQLYVHASEILGKKPLVMPQMHEQPGLTYQQLVAEGLDGFSNAVVQLENYIPPPPPVKIRFWRSRKTPSRYYYYHYDYSYGDNQTVEAVPHRSMQLLRMVPTMHYFCIPKNNRLLSYWDTVDDRLFKIRHSMNIDGVKREIPLFAPPIDPGMLARATSAGISIGALLKDIQSSPGVYRYSIVYQKAVELCNELKSFGSEITAALEKKDAEHLALLRNTHESELLKMVKSIREKAIEEARETMESLVKSKDVIQERYKYYNEIKKYSGLEIAQLATMSYAAAFNIVGQAMVLASAPMKLVPDGFGGALVGLGGGALAFAAFGGGAKASEAMEKTGNAINQNAAIFDRAANIIGINASYLRRWDEWKLQERLAKKELKQIDKQIISAEIRVKIAEIELEKQNKQIEQTEETMEVMESKFSNEELYRWMSDELIKTYNNFYDIAYGTAKKAEKAYQFELGIPSSSFITPEVWDSSRKGLLAGQRLSLQLRQMDNAYMENNKREYEITKTISLSLVNPVGLLELRETGSCQVEIPEYLYDFDFPGQYLRRIKSVSLTIPCVTGPYASINAKLELVHSKVRTSTELKNGKYTQEDEDSRFLVNPIKPMAIATSNAQMDSGVFQLDFRDERYLPFEGAGAISTWKIELPDEFRQFDYGTITDVLIHINYTARDAANEKFKTEVKKQLMTMIDSMTSIPHLISLKNSFPAQFGKIVEMGVSDEDSDVPVTVTLNNNHIPHLIADYIQRHSDNLSLGDVSVFIQMKHPVSDSFDLVLTLNGEESSSPTPISQNRTILQYAFEMNGDVQDLPLGDWEFLLANADRLEIEDIFLFFNYPSRAGQ